jgi:hypothetical protein
MTVLRRSAALSAVDTPFFLRRLLAAHFSDDQRPSGEANHRRPNRPREGHAVQSRHHYSESCKCFDS